MANKYKVGDIVVLNEKTSTPGLIARVRRVEQDSKYYNLELTGIYEEDAMVRYDRPSVHENPCTCATACATAGDRECNCKNTAWIDKD